MKYFYSVLLVFILKHMIWILLPMLKISETWFVFHDFLMKKQAAAHIFSTNDIFRRAARRLSCAPTHLLQTRNHLI